jgi:hypothetical protein
MPPIPVCVIRPNGGVPGGRGGKPNSFIVPNVTKSTPATMRTTLRMRLGQGGGAGSKIDMAFCSGVDRV